MVPEFRGSEVPGFWFRGSELLVHRSEAQRFSPSTLNADPEPLNLNLRTSEPQNLGTPEPVSYNPSMSERTAAALARIDVLIPALASLPAGAQRDEVVEVADALRRAIASFHMEAIRFRMHTMERMLRREGVPDTTLAAFDALRLELEAAGFHTRSHSAP